MHHGRSGSRRSGNVIVLVVVSLLGLLGLTGLVIDGGRVMAERRQAQNAADAAAIAAAVDLYNGLPAATARQTALTYAARNGYTNDGKTNTVVVNIPPKSGPNAGNANFIEVLATHDISTSFIKVVYPKAAQAQTRGVAGWTKSEGSHGLIVLNRTKKNALRAKDADLTVVGSSIYVNSSHKKQAASAAGNAKVTGSSIRITGGYRESGQGEFAPTPVTGVTPLDDPLGTLTAPPTNGLSTFSKVNSGQGGNKTITLEPGVYNGGINIGGDANVVMQPGTYVMNGGGFRVETKGNLTGKGVLIYNTGSQTRTDGEKSEQYGDFQGDHQDGVTEGKSAQLFGPFSLKVGGDCSLTPPTQGDYAGLTLFQDRANSQSAEITLKPDGQLVSGTLYLPNARIKLAGNGTMDGSQIIANRVYAKQGKITLKYDASKTAKQVDIALVE